MATSSSRVEFSVLELMYVGSNLSILGNVTANTLSTPTRSKPISILDRLQLLQNDLQLLELSRSESVLLSDLQELIRRLEDPNRTSRRLEHDAPHLRSLARRVESALQLEAATRRTFVVQRSREEEIEKLLQDPTAYFGVSAEGPLELTAQGSDDFREAARCYAVGFTAASIMFMLRATEEVLRGYYQQVTQQSASGAWGNLTTTLKIPVLRCPSSLTTKLEMLVKKRNQAMHPQARVPGEWDEEAAKQVLQDCREVISMMVEDLNSRDNIHLANWKPT